MVQPGFELLIFCLRPSKRWNSGVQLTITPSSILRSTTAVNYSCSSLSLDLESSFNYAQIKNYLTHTGSAFSGVAHQWCRLCSSCDSGHLTGEVCMWQDTLQFYIRREVCTWHDILYWFIYGSWASTDFISQGPRTNPPWTAVFWYLDCPKLCGGSWIPRGTTIFRSLSSLSVTWDVPGSPVPALEAATVSLSGEKYQQQWS